MSVTDCLPNLQTLQIVTVQRRTVSLMDSGRFPKLRKLFLRCNYFERCSPCEYLQGLHRLKGLQRLQLQCFSDIPLDPKAFPSSLTKMTMYNADPRDSFDYNCMATLGRLPNLRVLKVTLPDVQSYGSLSCVAGSFPKLEVFQLECMRFERWILEEGAMPFLQHLVIYRCDLLNELPEQLWSLTSLEDVLVDGPASELRENLRYVKPQNGCKIIIKG